MTGTVPARAEAAAGLAVWGADAVPGVDTVRAALMAERVPGRLVAKDPTLWGPDAEPEARVRLGWVDTVRRSRRLLDQLAELRAELSDLEHVVLAGMGGSSLAPEVICRTLGRPLTVLDTTDPHQLRAALGDRLDSTVVVVSSKSGTTIETDSQRRAYWQAFRDAGLSEAEAGRRFVMVTDPGTPLVEEGQRMGAVVVLADPEVGGRYSALTAFGLVPAALAGVDVVELLDQAEALLPALGDPENNPGLALGAALAAAATGGRDKVALVEDGTGIVGLGDWVEQLLAESTGKQDRGILPVVVESPGAHGATGRDVLTVTVGGSLPAGAVPGGGVYPHLAVNGPLGAQFLVWEYATAVAGRVLEINPFDQPNVTESKDNTAAILRGGLPVERPAAVDGAIEIYGSRAGSRFGSLTDALTELVSAAGDDGYLAVMAYLDRHADGELARLRELLVRASGRPVTFGWGPRFLHSTGQFHKGGPQQGCFLQITGVVGDDLPVPDRPYSFGTLQAAQAAGDRQALANRGRPVLRLHLTGRTSGIEQLLAAAAALPGRESGEVSGRPSDRDRRQEPT